MPIFVGVDAGGTSIDCAIERDGVTTEVRGEPANVRTEGIDRAASRIVATVRSGMHDGPFDALAVGAAGAGDAPIARALEVALRASFPTGRIAVYDDAEIALRAAVPRGDGAVLIAGTGSIAYARVGEHAYRVGGYGYLLGDDGSAFAIGRAALVQMLRWYDGRAPHSELFDALALRLQANDAQSVLDSVYNQSNLVAAIAALAPIVLDRAGSNERTATKIVQNAAHELVELLKALLGRADMTKRELPLVFSGGLFAENSLLSYLIETRLLADVPLLQPIKSAPAPVRGALALARGIA